MTLLLEAGAPVDSGCGHVEQYTFRHSSGLHGLVEPHAFVSSSCEGTRGSGKTTVESWCNRLNRWGENSTHLCLAVANGHNAIVKLLLESGATLDLTDTESFFPPLSRTAANGHKGVTRLLLESDATVNSRDSEKFTPLSRTPANDHEAVAKLLLEADATVDVKENQRRRLSLMHPKEGMTQ